MRVQDAELSRVADRIGDFVHRFCKARILRHLRARRLVSYRVVNRRSSLYCVTSVRSMG